MSRKLFVIDDNPIDISLLRGLIRKWGLDYTIVANDDNSKPADNTEVAREQFSNQILELVRKNVDEYTEAIFLDVLFETDSEEGTVEEALGYHLGKEIRRTFPQLPIILFTNRGQLQDIRSAPYFFNFDGYIPKSDFRKWRNSSSLETELFRAKQKRLSVLEECEQVRSEGKDMRDTSKPRLFIGSSVEGLPIANVLQQNLEYDVEVTVWNQAHFRLSRSTIESLLEALRNTDFGVFVFSPDDVAKIRGRQSRVVRDNVIFELGLFIGLLGRERSYYVVPREQQNFHLPTDLIGVTPATYDANRSDKSLKAALGPACEEIRQAIKEALKT